MIRLLLFLVLIFALALGGAWIADRPGAVDVTWLGYEIQTSTTVAVVVLLALVVVAIILWSLFRAIVTSPGRMSRFFDRRRRERGFRALSNGLIAVGSGDQRLARRYAVEARRTLPREPAVALLEAQTAQLGGDRAQARALFADMLSDQDTRLLGLHGLYVEAIREGEGEAARHCADEAVQIAPSLPWAAQAQFEHAAADRDWETATKILDRNTHNKLVDKATSRRLKAVLLTARALELELGEPEKAKGFALEAHSLAPDLVPAATVAARLLARLGDVRRAAKVIEQSWKKEPHPELAEAYSHIRHGDAARDRLKRMRSLAALRPTSSEGSFAIAEAAIDAREFDEARTVMRPVLETSPTQRACLLMAEIEEAETNDQGRVREWLSRALRAPKDPVWTADGIVSETWAPVSPVSGRLDAFEWRVPVEALGGVVEPPIDKAMLEPATAQMKTVGPAEPASADAAVVAVPAAAAAPAPKPEAAADKGSAVEPDEIVPPPAPPAAMSPPPSASEPETGQPAQAAAPAEAAADANRTAAGSNAPAGSNGAAQAGSAEYPLHTPPDDPGPDTDEGEEPQPKRRLRFFN
ncbi:heme biosynthesis protein HemY [Amorphus orientalis]|uniref:HemY protein n=1 Tax=Amorphus orientalis TaxID=649198 RepID=A0AAE3VNF3_9HYPH|nr:heme biosynthesis HemY N-terminal domain-containing protein [Amorphus orientalis]MDQ0315185.1 HemY protein [Amorphus orientalis]